MGKILFATRSTANVKAAAQGNSLTYILAVFTMMLLMSVNLELLSKGTFLTSLKKENELQIAKTLAERGIADVSKDVIGRLGNGETDTTIITNASVTDHQVKVYKNPLVPGDGDIPIGTYSVTITHSGDQYLLTSVGKVHGVMYELTAQLSLARGRIITTVAGKQFDNTSLEVPEAGSMVAETNSSDKIRYVSDMYFHRIIGIKQDGTKFIVAGGGTSRGSGIKPLEAVLYEPFDLFLKDANTLFFTEREGNRLIKITNPSTPNSATLTVLTGGLDVKHVVSNTLDNLAANANMDKLGDLVLDSSDNAYFVDIGDCLVRKYDPSSGYVTTFWGISTSAGDSPNCGTYPSGSSATATGINSGGGNIGLTINQNTQDIYAAAGGQNDNTPGGVFKIQPDGTLETILNPSGNPAGSCYTSTIAWELANQAVCNNIKYIGWFRGVGSDTFWIASGSKTAAHRYQLWFDGTDWRVRAHEGSTYTGAGNMIMNNFIVRVLNGGFNFDIGSDPAVTFYPQASNSNSNVTSIIRAQHSAGSPWNTTDPVTTVPQGNAIEEYPWDQHDLQQSYTSTDKITWWPYGIVVDPSDITGRYLYVTDRWDYNSNGTTSSRLVRVDLLNHTFTNVTTGGSSSLGGINVMGALALGSGSENLYIASYESGAIVRMDPTNPSSFTVLVKSNNTTGGDSTCTAPDTTGCKSVGWHDLVVSSSNVYAAQPTEGVVKLFNAGSNSFNTYAGTWDDTSWAVTDGTAATSNKLGKPQAVTLDPGGTNLYIASQAGFSSCITRVSLADGKIYNFAGNCSTDALPGGRIPDQTPKQDSNAHFVGITDLAFDPDGNLTVLDGWNSTVYKINVTDNLIYRLAGMGSHGYAGDGGSATSAYLYQPTQVAIFDRTGAFDDHYYFVTDLMSRSIRQF